METEMDHTMMDQGSQMDMPVDSTTGNAPDEELMYTTTGDGVEYQSTIGDLSSATDLSDAQVAGLAAVMGVYLVFALIIAAVSIVATWKIFTKAGRKGWESLIPLYNIYVLLKVVGRPGWWLLLLFIPLVNIVIALLIAIDLAKSFGKSTAFGVVALFLFSIVGYVILAFGKDKYVGLGSSPVAQPSAPSAPPTPEAAPPATPAV